ncbi:MAG: sigma-54-dependent Fis family transcriptional regulator [bacterium]|nr:sigma-54-dependent Fis family transcriptional regulator [bacterium]
MANAVLLITEDRGVTQKVRDACQKLDAQLMLAATLEEAEEILAAQFPHLVLCDYLTFEKLRASWPRVCVLLYAQPGDSDQAIEAIKRGALDYLVSPIVLESLVKHIQDALRISRDIHVPAVYEDPKEDAAVERVVGQSPAMKEVYKLIGLIAPRNVNVLITGESGTGKELVARAILHHSPRKDQPFLAVNCAAIPETLLESELFGHEKGAFTGADLRRIGKFEQCHGGTLFLDEIGDIPLSTQAKLLRVLQDNTIQRLGGTGVIECDVRIIAATHQSLERLIQERRFRQDLLYRLKVTSIDVPPLREREVDVVLLAHYFVDRYRRDLGADIQSFAPETLPVLLRYPWPGNVRELENAIKAALVVGRGTVLRPEFLPEHIGKGTEAGSTTISAPPSLPAESPSGYLRSVAESLISQPTLSGKLHETATAMIEREIVRVCLEHTRGQLSPAAKLLGISRTTLRKRMSRHGIRATVSVDADR